MKYFIMSYDLEANAINNLVYKMTQPKASQNTTQYTYQVIIHPVTGQAAIAFDDVERPINADTDIPAITNFLRDWASVAEIAAIQSALNAAKGTAINPRFLIELLPSLGDWVEELSSDWALPQQGV